MRLFCTSLSKDYRNNEDGEGLFESPSKHIGASRIACLPIYFGGTHRGGWGVRRRQMIALTKAYYTYRVCVCVCGIRPRAFDPFPLHTLTIPLIYVKLIL